MIEYMDLCPMCEYPLVIEEDGPHYVIRDVQNNAVTTCPNCLTALHVEGGELMEGEE